MKFLFSENLLRLDPAKCNDHTLQGYTFVIITLFTGLQNIDKNI